MNRLISAIPASSHCQTWETVLSGVVGGTAAGADSWARPLLAASSACVSDCLETAVSMTLVELASSAAAVAVEGGAMRMEGSSAGGSVAAGASVAISAAAAGSSVAAADSKVMSGPPPPPLPNPTGWAASWGLKTFKPMVKKSRIVARVAENLNTGYERGKGGFLPTILGVRVKLRGALRMGS